MNDYQHPAKPLLWPTPLLLAVLAGGCGQWKQADLPVGVDITAPTINATTPSLAASVTPNVRIKALFSEAMDSTSINETTFILSKGTTPVLGTVSYEKNVATLRPIADLEMNSVFTATITTEARDVAGNPLGSSRSWTFTTTAPVAARPGLGAIGEDS
jgi:hypothetical protein